MNAKTKDAACELAICALLILIVVSAGMLLRKSRDAPNTLPVVSTENAVVTGAFSTVGAKPQFAFPVISGARNVAEFASDLASGYRSDGKIDAQLLLPTNMRGQAAREAGSRSAASLIGGFTDSPDTADDQTNNSSACRGGQCSQQTGWHWERRGFGRWVQVED